ncbi:hypothetical protein M2137_002329 [Parabacteroides sp. PFB2-10]|nr:hypothetical protein [Parabacteroides sp. PFB2-10]
MLHETHFYLIDEKKQKELHIGIEKMQTNVKLPVFGETPNLRFVISARLCAQKSRTSETNSREKHFLTYGFVSKRGILLTIAILTF